MSVDLYIGCRDCKCAVHTQINARHEVAEGLLDLRWTSEFAAQALPWLREHEDFGPKHEVTQVLAPFCELHAGHTLGIVGDDDVGRGPWRREDAPLPGVGALGAKKKGAREDAARLARFGQDPAALEPLLAALAKDRALSVRVEAARSLASLANTQELRGEALEPVRGALVAALGHEKPELRCGALEALGWLASGCPEDPMVYFEPVCERSADERASVAELLLVALEDAEALEDKPAMEQGLRALTFTRDPRALEAALPLLGDEAPQVRAAAIATLRAATQEGGELGAAAEALAEAAEASVLAAPAGSPRTQAERQWGEILASVGALWPMKELFRRRGWFAQALQQASVGPWQHGRWPLERQAGPQPVVRADLAQPGEELWERPAPLQPHRQPCLSDVDARGDLVAAAGESGVALLYRLSSGERRELVHVPPERRNEELRAVALSPEGALLATGDSKGAVKVWDCASGERVRGFYCGEPVTRLRWFPADEWLLVAGEASLEVRDREGELVQRFPLGHSGAVLEARLDPSGEWLATRGGTHASRGDAAVHVYSLATGQPWTTIEGPCPATGVRWSPCAQRLAILDEKRDLRVYDLASGEVLASLRADYPKQDFALLREGVLLAKKGPTWVGFSGQVERKLDFDGAALAQGPDGQVVFAGGDGSLHVVRGDPSRGAEVRRLAHAQAAQGEPAVAWVGDTIAAVFGSSQPSQVLLLSAGGEERGCLAGERSPKALAISPDEGLLALLCQRQVQVFELASGALLWQREGHFYDPVSLEFDPGGERLIYCDKADSVGGRRPGWVEVRDARSGELRGRHGGRSLVGAVDLSPDGKQVAFGGGLLSSSRDLQANAPCDVLLWDLDECGVVRRLRDEPRRERVLGERCLWVRAVAFSPAGDALATAMQGGLTLWDL
ncbi:MAG TPA: hypothetical protein DEA08_11570, partial [Planctomycetes bacterium]|nr:hypothetical protein [Planctomycetota bacterium]